MLESMLDLAYCLDFIYAIQKNKTNILRQSVVVGIMSFILREKKITDSPRKKKREMRFPEKCVEVAGRL